MKKLDERKKGYEGKFARDQELEFKILARRNKYLGVWAAEKLGLSGQAVQDYCTEVVKSDLEEAGDMDVFRKVRKDLDEKSMKEILESLINDKPMKPGSFRGRKNTAPEKDRIINGAKNA